eukprot:XP_011683774.1 PREDICTED: uncharacterized protein LOC105447435 isoform X2 [Strongylocentrotus purpuratus]
MDTNSQLNELGDSSTGSCVSQDSNPSLMYSFLGGYIAGVASILLLILVALIVYIILTRCRHAPLDVKSVSALPPGIYEECNREQGVTKGSVVGLDDDHQYQEMKITSLNQDGIYSEI